MTACLYLWSFRVSSGCLQCLDMKTFGVLCSDVHAHGWTVLVGKSLKNQSPTMLFGHCGTLLFAFLVEGGTSNLVITICFYYVTSFCIFHVTPKVTPVIFILRNFIVPFSQYPASFTFLYALQLGLLIVVAFARKNFQCFTLYAIYKAVCFINSSAPESPQTPLSVVPASRDHQMASVPCHV